MALKIVRTPEEIDAMRQRAQAAAFAAEDQGGEDEAASAIYDALQYLFGDSDIDPTEEMGEDPDSDEDEQA